MTWAELLDQWSLLEADLQDAGVDVGDHVLMESRSWRWFETRVAGLLEKPPVGFVQVANPDDEHRPLLKPLYGSRLQQHFYAS